jgi:hypothetical protein
MTKRYLENFRAMMKFDPELRSACETLVNSVDESIFYASEDDSPNVDISNVTVLENPPCETVELFRLLSQNTESSPTLDPGTQNTKNGGSPKSQVVSVQKRPVGRPRKF